MSAAKKTTAAKAGVPEAPAPVDQPDPITPEGAEVVKKTKAAKSPEIGSAAWQRADRIRALEEEKRGYEVLGLKDRMSEVDAALKAARSQVKDRGTKPSDEA